VAKVGKSYLVKILIPKKIGLILTRKRLLYIFSINRRLMYKFMKSIYYLKPADIYKGAGIQ
jgi:hypothetical protein